jgi:hypothetical protein
MHGKRAEAIVTAWPSSDACQKAFVALSSVDAVRPTYVAGHTALLVSR